MEVSNQAFAGESKFTYPQVRLDECEAIIAEFMDLDDDSSNDSEQLSKGQLTSTTTISDCHRADNVWTRVDAIIVFGKHPVMSCDLTCQQGRGIQPGSREGLP